MTQSLLPPQNTTPRELAISETSAEFRPVQYGLLKTLWDPWTCPEQFLPYLARALSVDLWEDDWPLQKKRYVTAHALEHHRAKGSLWLIEEYMRILGFRVVRIVTSPQRCWPGRGMSDADYQTWLSRLAQVRIYPYHPQTFRPLATASFSRYRTRRSFYGKSFLVRGLPIEATEKVAKLWDQGTETDLTWRSVEDRSVDGKAVRVEQIILPATGRNRPAFYGISAYGKAFLVRSRIGERVAEITTPVDVTRPEFHATRKTVVPNGDLVSLVPEKVIESGPAPVGATICGHRAWGRTFYLTPTTWKRVYERFHVNDPTRWAGLSSGRPRKFYGHCRFGIQPHTIEVLVDMSFKRSPRRMGRFYGSCAFARRPQGIEKIRAGMRAAKTLDDTVLITTQTRRTPTVDDRIKVGSYRIGDTIAV